MDETIRAATIFCLVGIFTYSRRVTTTWANPVSFYVVPFIAILTVQEIILRSLPFGWRAAAVILGSALSLLVGVAVIWLRPLAASMTDQELDLRQRSRALQNILLVCCYAVALLYLYELRQAVEQSAATVNGVFYPDVFAATTGNTFVLRALQAGTYLGAFYVAFDARTRRHPLPYLATYAAIVLFQDVSSSFKSGVLTVGLLFLVSHVTARPRQYRKVSLRRIVPAVLLVVLAAGVFYQVTLQRSKGSASAVAEMEYSLAGSPSALSLALDHKVLLDTGGFGLSFAGIRQALEPSDQRTLGVYSQSVVLFPGRQESEINIYTWFVPLIHDFGVAGAVVAVPLGLGLVGGLLTRRHLRGVVSVGGLGALVLINFLLAEASIVPATYYNYYLLLVVGSLGLGLLYRHRDPDVDAMELGRANGDGATAAGDGRVRGLPARRGEVWGRHHATSAKKYE